MKSTITVAVFLILAILHQDSWNWDKAELVFGFLPVGLAYHALYSLVVVLFWALVVIYAWPEKLEAWAEGDD